MNALIASLQFTTAIPLGKPRPFNPKTIIPCFPLAGLAIGLFVALFDALALAVWHPFVAGTLDVVLLAAITGALHLDGLADTADGLYGNREREKALAIMKDSRVGAMGLVAVVCVLLVKAASLGQVEEARFLALVVVPAYSRSAMMAGIRFLPYVRGKEGTGSAFFETPLTPTDFRWVALPILLSFFMGWRGLLLNLVFVVAVALLLCFYKKKLGGITGDLLGGMVEIVETTLFLTLCVGGAP